MKNIHDAFAARQQSPGYSGMSRRSFLSVTALAGGGVALGVMMPSLLPGAFGGSGQALAQGDQPAINPMQWIQIKPDNSIVFLVDKSEMGQGVNTSMPMLIAEELDPDWSLVSYEYAPAAPQFANPLFGVQGTGGSTSVRAMYEPLRRAGAAAREWLIAGAARSWDVDASDVTAESGRLRGPGGKTVTYGEILSVAAEIEPPDMASVKLKPASAFERIGKPVKRLDSEAKVTGKAEFGIDVELPGLLTAVIARAPVLGAKVASFDGTKARAVPGVRMVTLVHGPVQNGVAVVAESYWAAKMGRDVLEVTWSESEHAGLSSEGMADAMRTAATEATEAVLAVNEGDVSSAKPVKTIDAWYEQPYLAHATMEPINLTVWVKQDGVDIYGGTQAQGPNQFTVAQILGIKPEQVNIVTTNLGGGFGRRFAPDALIEALQISQAARAPVKLVYSREDDTRAEYYRPASTVRIWGGLDADGKPVGMHARAVCSSIAAGSGFEGALIKDRLDTTATEGLDNFPYDCANRRVEWVTYEPGIRTWFWRSVGNSQNAFVSESFIDELAWAAGKDPFEYRRDLLSAHPRQRAVLELAAEKAGWGKPVRGGRARGISVVESFGSYVAQVAEVSIRDGKPQVHRVTIAADVGTVINPDTVAAQMEGAMVYGLSAALHAKITIKDGQIEQSNFHDYPVLRMNEMPEVDVHIVASTEPPGGAGEPGTPPIAPAVANAIYALTGKRLRKLPFDLSA